MKTRTIPAPYVKSGRLLRRLRKRRGLTQTALTIALNQYPGGETIYRQLISAFECGDRAPTVDQLQAICGFFEVNIQAWLDQTNQQQEPKHQQCGRPKQARHR